MGLDKLVDISKYRIDDKEIKPKDKTLKELKE
jgi:hypothetical protein